MFVFQVVACESLGRPELICVSYFVFIIYVVYNWCFIVCDSCDVTELSFSSPLYFNTTLCTNQSMVRYTSILPNELNIY